MCDIARIILGFFIELHLAVHSVFASIGVECLDLLVILAECQEASRIKTAMFFDCS